MNWIKQLPKPLGLLTLSFTLWAGVAAAEDTTASQQVKSEKVQLEISNMASPAPPAEPVRLAWDRVGSQA
ncbi:MAG TPA: hypothetical protein VIN38_03745 [Thiobacillus sp.]